MALSRWPLLGLGFVFVASIFACTTVQRGEPVPCEHDVNCGDGFICEGLLARVCVAAIECTGDSQCPVGASCIERTATPPDNPFEGGHVSKQVCDCLDGCGTGGFNAGGEPAGGQGGRGGSGGSGGEPAGGHGGQGGSGGEPAGGHGGSGGAQQGGAGGQGGAK